MQSLMLDDLCVSTAPRVQTSIALTERLYEPFDPDEARMWRQAMAVARMRAQTPDDLDDDALPTIVAEHPGPIDDPYMELDVDP